MITTKQQIKVASEWTVKSLFRSYNFAGNDDDGAVKVKVTGIFNLIINHPRTTNTVCCCFVFAASCGGISSVRRLAWDRVSSII